MQRPEVQQSPHPSRLRRDTFSRSRGEGSIGYPGPAFIRPIARAVDDVEACHSVAFGLACAMKRMILRQSSRAAFDQTTVRFTFCGHNATHAGFSRRRGDGSLRAATTCAAMLNVI